LYFNASYYNVSYFNTRIILIIVSRKKLLIRETTITIKQQKLLKLHRYISLNMQQTTMIRHQVCE